MPTDTSVAMSLELFEAFRGTKVSAQHDHRERFVDLLTYLECINFAPKPNDLLLRSKGLDAESQWGKWELRTWCDFN